MVHPPRGLIALLLLHVVLLCTLGVFGVLRAASAALLENNFRVSSGLSFGYGALALALGGSFILLMQRNPLRNARAVVALGILGLVTAAVAASALPLYVYRLQSVPLTSWLIAVPPLLLAGLALTHARHLRRGRGAVGQDHILPDSMARSGTHDPSQG